VLGWRRPTECGRPHGRSGCVPGRGPKGEGRRYDVLPMLFLPEAGLAKKAERDQADYLRWMEAGF